MEEVREGKAAALLDEERRGREKEREGGGREAAPMPYLPRSPSHRARRYAPKRGRVLLGEGRVQSSPAQAEPHAEAGAESRRMRRR